MRINGRRPRDRKQRCFAPPRRSTRGRTHPGALANVAGSRRPGSLLAVFLVALGISALQELFGDANSLLDRELHRRAQDFHRCFGHRGKYIESRPIRRATGAARRPWNDGGGGGSRRPRCGCSTTLQARKFARFRWCQLRRALLSIVERRRIVASPLQPQRTRGRRTGGRAGDAAGGCRPEGAAARAASDRGVAGRVARGGHGGGGARPARPGNPGRRPRAPSPPPSCSQPDGGSVGTRGRRGSRPAPPGSRRTRVAAGCGHGRHESRKRARARRICRHGAQPRASMSAVDAAAVGHGIAAANLRLPDGVPDHSCCQWIPTRTSSL
jgi:hypothetical protein